MAHPRMYDDTNPAIKRLREICLALPGVFEKEAWGECTFRVTGGSMFAMTDNNHHNSGHVAVWVKAPAMAQEILVRSDPKRFFIPPYVGRQGWVGLRIDNKVQWDDVVAILKTDTSYRRQARGALEFEATLMLWRPVPLQNEFLDRCDIGSRPAGCATKPELREAGAAVNSDALRRRGAPRCLMTQQQISANLAGVVNPTRF